MSSVELTADSIIAVLRDEGSDVADIEAKAAQGGYPEDLAPTLSAFANLPGGGVIVLGLDERDGFTAAGVYDPVQAKQRLAAQARDAVQPPLKLAFESVDLDGRTVVLARVPSLPAADKPCTVISTGRAYLRSYDGDYPLSEQERAAFVAERGTPRHDREPVAGSTRDDLDPALLTAYLVTVRSRSPRLGGMSDEEILHQTRILVEGGEVTLGGLYALGEYPQRHVPTLSISARVVPRTTDPPGTRSGDLTHFDGPLPDLLDQVLTWVRRNTSTRVRIGPDGHGRDEPTYPAEAVRELVANALVHRDLGPHALGDRVHVVLQENRLVIANPGGLFGLTVEQLGRRIGGSARNQSLYDIAKDVRAADGRRIIEGVGTGIAAARDALAEAGMTPPYFLDSGVRFTALVPQHALLDPDDIRWVTAVPDSDGLSETQRHALVAMRQGTEWTNRSFREQFPMDSTHARALLVDLVERGLAEATGDRGGRTYRLHPSLSGETAQSVRAPDVLEAEEGLAQQPALTRHGPRILRALAIEPLGVRQLADQLELSTRQITWALNRLRKDGHVRFLGGKGVRDSRYELVSRPEGTERP